LPEDRRIAHAALQRGIAVLSLTAADSYKKCWNHDFFPKKNDDAHHLNRTITTWIRGVKLPKDIIRLGAGASSGGTFLFRVWRDARFVAMAPYISIGGDTLMFDRQENGKLRLPPSIFSVMERENAEFLHMARIIMKPTLTELIVQEKVPFTVLHCKSRLPEFDMRRKRNNEEDLSHTTSPCYRFVQLLSTGSKPYLNKKFYVRHSPTGPEADRSWVNAFLKVLQEFPTAPKLVEWERTKETRRGEVPLTDFYGRNWLVAAVEETLASCFAFHETSSDGVEKVLDFFDSHARVL